MSYSSTNNINIYSQFTNKIPRNLKEILYHTKKLIVNSKNYHNYSKNYLKTTQINSFKTPNNGNYPLIKNKQLIPLNKSIYHFYVNNKTENEEKENDKNNNIIIRHVKYNSDNLFSSPRKKIKYKKIIKEVNKNIEQEKIFILRDIFFHDENYNYLVYDESLIFYKYNYYQDYIINVIKKFKIEKNENLTTFLVKNYENNSTVDLNENFNENKTSITLKSMKIEFTNLSDSSKKNISFQIPFSYLPLFAFNNFKYLKEFLIAIFKFNKTFDEITFEEGELINFLNNFEKFDFKNPTTKNLQKNIFKGNLHLDANDLNEKLNYKKATTTHIEILKKIRTVTETPHSTFKKNSVFHINNNNKNNINNNIKKNIFLFEKKNKIKSLFDIYHFFWMTPNNRYKVIIKLPEIQINLNNLVITKFIDIELILFLIKKNFINWDFYVIDYLFSFRNFRFITEKILSKSLKNIESVYNKEKNGYINFQKVKDVLYCNLTKEKNNNYQSENFYRFSFFYTESNLKNYIKTLNSYSCKIFNEYINDEKVFDFKFNFKQMKILNKISKNQNLIGFLNKLIITNRQLMQIELNYEFFDNFEHYDYFFLPDIEHPHFKRTASRRYSKKKSFTRSLSRQSINSILNITGESKKDLNKYNYENKEKNKNNNINNFIIKLRQPFLEIMEYDNDNFTGNCIKVINHENDNSFDDYEESSIINGIKIDILNKICKEKDISEWTNILINENNIKKMKIDENNSTKHSKKSTVRFSTVKRISNVTNGPKNSFLRKNSNIKKNSMVLNYKNNKL